MPVLVVRDLVLAPGARSLSFELFAGDGYAVMGRSSSVKDAILDALKGKGKPVSGSLDPGDGPVCPLEREPGRRHTPVSLAKKYGDSVTKADLAEVLSALGLWEARQTPVAHLSDALASACDLVPVFVSNASWALVDGEMDRLDPWIRESALGLVEGQMKRGKAFVIGTHLSTVVDRLGQIIVAGPTSALFAGPVGEFIASYEPQSLVVETDDPTSVRTMVEPFSLAIKATKTGLLIQAHKGQELAAKLLTEGYGSVRSVIVKEPSLLDALLNRA